MIQTQLSQDQTRIANVRKIIGFAMEVHIYNHSCRVYFLYILHIHCYNNRSGITGTCFELQARRDD